MNLDICWDASKAVIIIKCPKILKVNTSKRFGHVICEQFYFILRYLWITYSFLKKIPYWIFFFFPFHTLDLISLKTKQYKKNIALKICKFQFEGKKLIQLNIYSDTRKKKFFMCLTFGEIVDFNSKRWKISFFEIFFSIWLFHIEKMFKTFKLFRFLHCFAIFAVGQFFFYFDQKMRKYWKVFFSIS